MFRYCILLGFLFSTFARAAEKPVLTLDARGHVGSVWKVLFTPDGQQLLSIGEDRSVRVWDLATGETVRVYRPPIGPGNLGALRAAALAPDGDLLAVSGATVGDAIYLISLARGQLVGILEGHENVVFALAFSPDGKKLVSGSADETARIWDVANRKCAHVLTGHSHRIVDAGFSPDGRLVATASFDRTTRIHSAVTGKLQRELAGHTSEVRCLAWSPDGTQLATGSKDQSVRLWDARRAFAPGKKFERLGATITSVRFLPRGGSLLLTRGVGERHDCSILDLTTGKETVRLRKHDNTVLFGTLSPDGSLAATTGGNDASTLVWKTTDGSVVQTLVARGRTPWQAGWSPDGRRIAWSNDPEGTLDRTFDLNQLELAGASTEKFTTAILRRGGQPITLKPDTPEQAVVLQGGKPLLTIELGDGEQARCVSLLGEDRIVLGTSGGLSTYDLATGKRLHTYLGAGSVWAVSPSPDGKRLLTASDDQVLRVFPVDRPDPLLSLFVAGNDWICWSSEGTYAASPGGERLMGWYVGASDRLGTFHPAARFHATLFRPDVVRRLRLAGSLAEALRQADRARGKPSVRHVVGEILPPVVVLTSPDRTILEVEDGTTEIRFVARAVGKHPITRVRLLVNGRPCAGTEAQKAFDPPRETEIRESWTIKLPAGENTLAVQAETRVSSALSEPVTVVVGARAMFRRPVPVKESSRPNLYVLAIGVAEYPGKLRLRYAARDARTLVATYAKHSKAIYRNVEVKLLTDREATRKAILQGLTWLRKQMTQHDVAVVFFAGHGGKDADGAFFLFPVDVDSEDLLSSAVPGDQLKKTLAGMPGRFVVMLDACHAGAVGGIRSASPLTDDLVRDLASDDNGIVVMCSSMGREFSFEDPKVEHGYFTLALVEGLSGKADYDRDGVIHLNELDLYVTGRVKELSRGKQHPVTARPTSVRSFPLARSAAAE